MLRIAYSQTDGAKDGRGSWEAILRNSWFDVLNILGGPPKNIILQ